VNKGEKMAVSFNAIKKNSTLIDFGLAEEEEEE
jgi:hypothetical protein